MIPRLLETRTHELIGLLGQLRRKNSAWTSASRAGCQLSVPSKIGLAGIRVTSADYIDVWTVLRLPRTISLVHAVAGRESSSLSDSAGTLCARSYQVKLLRRGQQKSTSNQMNCEVPNASNQFGSFCFP